MINGDWIVDECGDLGCAVIWGDPNIANRGQSGDARWLTGWAARYSLTQQNRCR